jgi:hypothetical protein
LTVPGQDRIPELLAEGHELLSRSCFPEAADVFGRILLLDASHEEARLGLESAQRAAAEARRQLDAALEEARAAVDAGQLARARPLLERVIEQGGDRDSARALLDRMDRREGRLFGGPPPFRAADSGSVPIPRPGGRWSRPALVVAWACCFALLGAGVASSWERLVRGLVEPPAPAPAPRPPVTQPPAQSPGERAVIEARRLAERGDAGAALALLDRIPPDEPAYPFARRYRAQVEAALRHGGRAR